MIGSDDLMPAVELPATGTVAAVCKPSEAADDDASLRMFLRALTMVHELLAAFVVAALVGRAERAAAGILTHSQL